MAFITASSIPAAALFLSSTLSLVLLWIVCSKRQKIQAQPSACLEQQQEESRPLHIVQNIQQQQVEQVRLEEGVGQITSVPSQLSVLSEGSSTGTFTQSSVMAQGQSSPGTALSSPRLIRASSGSQTLPAPQDDNMIAGAAKSAATESVINCTRELQSLW